MAIECSIVHNIPGRVRLRVSNREVVRRFSSEVHRYLLARLGTTSVRINASCSSIVVAYEPSSSTPQSLAAELTDFLLDRVSAFVTVERRYASPQTKYATRRPSLAHPLSRVRELVARIDCPPHRRGESWAEGKESAFGSLEPAGDACGSCSTGDRAWHMVDADEAIRVLGSDAVTGLGLADAGDRLFSFGPNSLGRIAVRSPWLTLAEQFESLPVLLLVGSAAVSVATGGLADAVVILGVVAVNACIGYVTERQAERTILSLQDEAELPATVIRDGRRQSIAVDLVVPGDMLVLTPGTAVVADVRLVEAQRLMMDESALTGESMPVRKAPNKLAGGHVALRERRNMAYRGTTVTGGSGLGIVVETGLTTEVGRIQRLVGSAKAPQTPVQRQLGELGTKLGVLTGAICVGVFGVGLLRRYAAVEMLKVATSLAVAAVPEGLPMVATTTLALGVNRMRRLNVAVRRLDAVETLGSVQVFCFDKTGTLTCNQMGVVRLYAGNRTFELNGHGVQHGGQDVLISQCAELRRLLVVAVLCNETDLREHHSGPVLDGSPTECALVRMALDCGVDLLDLRRACPARRTTYRTERRGYMTTLHEIGIGRQLLAVKGRPHDVLELCRWQLRDGGTVELSGDDRAAIRTENETMAGQGLRVLAFAFREFSSVEEPVYEDLTWLGLAGIADPVRPGMRELMQRFHRAGIRTIMITGDQSGTAHAVGRQLELSGSSELCMMDSAELEAIDPNMLKSLVQNVDVFSSVTPSHKLEIVRALQRAGQVVAMTGDGINDGPALKAADIGVAMGGDGGTDVARMTADVVLEDNNLQSMVTAITQGRAIHANTRNAIRYLLSTNLSEILVMLTGVASGIGPPLNPIQLLWINLVSDIVPVLALAVQPPEDDVLDRTPRDPAEPFLDRQDLQRMLVQSAMISGGTFGTYLWGRYRYGVSDHAGTMAFMSITAAQLLHMLSARSDRYTVFSARRPPTSAALYLTLVGGFGLQLITAFVSPLRRLLRNAPLAPSDMAVSLLGAGLPLLANEAVKQARLPRIPGNAPATTRTSTPGGMKR